MSRLVSEQEEFTAAMFPDIMALALRGYFPTAAESLAFDYFDLTGEARLVALHSARQCEATAAACYAALARSLVKR